MNDTLNNFNIAYKQITRHIAVFGLLIIDYLISGLVIFLIFGDVIDFENSKIISGIMLAISLSMSVALSAVAQAVIGDMFSNKSKPKWDARSIAIFSVSMLYVGLDVFIDGMIAPFILYGESPLRFWYYWQQGSVEFRSVVKLFWLFSLISEPGVIILLNWKLDKLKLPKIKKPQKSTQTKRKVARE